MSLVLYKDNKECYNVEVETVSSQEKDRAAPLRLQISAYGKIGSWRELSKTKD